MKTKKEKFVIAFIIFLGLILRLWGINFGLPYQFHQDEPIVVNHALAYGSGDFNPHFFAIPPLTSYILFFFYCLYFLFGRMLGLFNSSYDFALSFFNDPTMFYLLGRIVIGVIPGVLCILFTYILYKHIFTSNIGALFASSLIAFNFLNVVNSHYIYTDMLMLLCIILCIMQVMRIIERQLLRDYLISAALIGIACSIKYNSVILAFSLLTAHFIGNKKRGLKIIDKNIISACFISILFFIALNPFSVLDAKFFIKSILIQGDSEIYIGWSHHIIYSLAQSLGWIFIVTGVLGLIFIVFRYFNKGMVLISFPVIFYLHLVYFSQPFSRYAIPLIPFLAIGAGYFFFNVFTQGIKKRLLRNIFICAVCALLIPVLAKSVKASLLLSSVDTRIEVAEWVISNIAADEYIAMDHTFFRPVLLQNEKQLKEKYAVINRQAGLSLLKDKKLQLTLEAQKGKKSYNIYFLNQIPVAQGQFLATMPALPFDVSILRQKDIKYIVINYANRQNATENFYNEIKHKAKLLASFSPYRNNFIRMSYDMIDTTCMPTLSEEIYSRIKNGPAIEIYQLNK